MIRGIVQGKESLNRFYQEVDLVFMPSRTEGFGLTGRKALSAGAPLLIISYNSGFEEALSSVPFGSSFVINSEDPTLWTATMKRIWAKDKESRLEEAETLRDCYERKYKQATQMKDLVEKIITWTYKMNVNYRPLGRGKIPVCEEIKIMGKIQNKNKPKLC